MPSDPVEIAPGDWVILEGGRSLELPRPLYIEHGDEASGGTRVVESPPVHDGIEYRVIIETAGDKTRYFLVGAPGPAWLTARKPIGDVGFVLSNSGQQYHRWDFENFPAESKRYHEIDQKQAARFLTRPGRIAAVPSNLLTHLPEAVAKAFAGPAPGSKVVIYDHKPPGGKTPEPGTPEHRAFMEMMCTEFIPDKPIGPIGDLDKVTSFVRKPVDWGAIAEGRKETDESKGETKQRTAPADSGREGIKTEATSIAKRRRQGETEELVLKYLRSHPMAKSAEIAKHLGIAEPTVRNTRVWKDARKAEREARESSPALRAIQLSDEILVRRPDEKATDPLAELIEREETKAEMEYLDSLGPEARASYESASPADRAFLLECTENTRCKRNEWDVRSNAQRTPNER